MAADRDSKVPADRGAEFRKTGLFTPTALLAGHAAVLFVLFPNYESGSIALTIALAALTIGLPLAVAAWSLFYFPGDNVQIHHVVAVLLVAYLGSAVMLITAVGAMLYHLGSWTLLLYVWPLALVFWAGNPNTRLGRWVDRSSAGRFRTDEEE